MDRDGKLEEDNAPTKDYHFEELGSTIKNLPNVIEYPSNSEDLNDVSGADSQSSSYKSLPVGIQLSETAIDRIEKMLRSGNMFRDDDFFDTKYPMYAVSNGEKVQQRVEIYHQNSSIIYRYGNSKAIKRVDLDLEENYTDKRISDLSNNDTIGIGCFLQSCQEAVLQHDVFTGDENIAQVYDRWIQANPDRHEMTIDVEHMIDVIKYVQLKSSGEQPKFSPNIRQALEMIRGMSLFLEMDYYETDLLKWSEKLRPEDADSDMIGVAHQIIQGLQLIHTKGYIHMDLKPQNILLRVNNDTVQEVVLIDFGLARELCAEKPEENNGRCGTHPYNYCPDEYYTKSFDVWSLGIVIYHMVACVSEQSHITRSRLESVIKLAKRGELESGENMKGFHPTLRDLILMSLEADPDKRPSCEDLDTFML